jgi:hypothetical protein
VNRPPVNNPPAVNRTSVNRPPATNPPAVNRTPVNRTPVSNPPAVNRTPVNRTPVSNPPAVGRTPVNRPPIDRPPVRNTPGFQPGRERGGEMARNHGGDFGRDGGRFRGRDIPRDHFHSYFGRDHHFRMEHTLMIGGHPHFYRDGFRFGIIDPWPVAWAYSDPVFVDNVAGAYYLCNPRFPGVMLALNVADANDPAPQDPSSYAAAQPQPDNSADVDASQNAPTVAPGQTVGQVVAALGYPRSIIDLGMKRIYLYNDMRLTFMAGRLVDVR